ncbi:homoserine kinase [Sporosarcina sp. CAU 1771]
MIGASFSVVVPASTANLGPGFDSIGLALGLYMTVNVSPAEVWNVTYGDKGFEELSSGDDNLIVTTIKNIADRFDKTAPTLKLVIQSDIPLGKGFGSSASAIAAGIEIANQSLDLNLSENEKVRLGSQFEGHADNVSAALLGGTVISYFDGEVIDYIHVKEPKVGVVVLIPPAALATEESRGLLPEQLTHKEATRSSAAGSLLAAAVVQNDWAVAGRMMEKDGFHEPFRKHLFPEFDKIRVACDELGAYGMTISGAGPSLFVAVKEGTETEIANELATRFPYYESMAVQPSVIGSSIK